MKASSAAFAITGTINMLRATTAAMPEYPFIGDQEYS